MFDDLELRNGENRWVSETEKCYKPLHRGTAKRGKVDTLKNVLQNYYYGLEITWLDLGLDRPSYAVHFFKLKKFPYVGLKKTFFIVSRSRARGGIFLPAISTSAKWKKYLLNFNIFEVKLYHV